MLDNAATFRESVLLHINERDSLIEMLDKAMPELKPINTKTLLA